MSDLKQGTEYEELDYQEFVKQMRKEIDEGAWRQISREEFLQLPQGTRVKFDNLDKGTGTICGISSIAQPVIGCGYIIKPDRPIANYKYSHIVLFESQFEVMKESSKKQRILQEQNAAEAYHYAATEIKGRWPEAEHFIAKDPDWAYYYALEIIRDRWPEAEAAILKDPYVAYEYADTFGIKMKVTFEE
jgi:hypothetical protein